jgi:PAS domain-containing protein
VASGADAPKSLPLILAQQLASNLATPMFLLDPNGTLVYYNDAADQIIGKSFSEMGEIPSLEFGKMLNLSDPDGTPLRRRDSPAGVAFFQRRASHRRVYATGYDGIKRLVDATAYPLFGKDETLHGVVAVFWQADADES